MKSSVNNMPLERANTLDWTLGGSRKAQEIWICARHGGTDTQLTKDESKTSTLIRDGQKGFANGAEFTFDADATFGRPEQHRVKKTQEAETSIRRLEVARWELVRQNQNRIVDGHMPYWLCLRTAPVDLRSDAFMTQTLTQPSLFYRLQHEPLAGILFKTC
jgi:hypothetical protein